MDNTTSHDAPKTGEIEPGLWRVPEERLDILEALAVKLNKKAVRCGGAVTLEVVRTEAHTVRGFSGDRVRLYTLVRLGGEVPRVSGYSFVARVEHTKAGNIVARAPRSYGVSLPASLWSEPSSCDHCHTKRNRKDTFVLIAGESGALIRVGRQCLADYLRSTDVAQALQAWKALEDMVYALNSNSGEDEGSSSNRWYPTIESYLAATCAAIRLDGWVSKQKAYDSNMSSTADQANFASGAMPSRPNDIEDWKRLQANGADRVQAGEVLSWVRALSNPESDYLRNLVVACSLEYVTPRNTGLVASAVAAYLREQEALRSKQTPVGGYFGEVEKRYSLGTVKCVSCHVVEGTYGSTAIALFVNEEDGHYFKWFASSKTPRVGTRYDLTGTVKKHETYKGRFETVLTRCKIKEVEG